MTHKSLRDSLYPRRFLSYSRRDSAFVEQHLKRTRLLDNATFVDVDQIAPGETWREEVASAIESCDEFILLLSDHSASSVEVSKEIALARSLGKTLVVVAIDPLTQRSPMPCDDIHWINLTGCRSSPDLYKLLSCDWTDAKSVQSAAQVKMFAARTLWPAFTGERPDTGIECVGHALRAAAPRSANGSPIVLNHGLFECHFRQYELGLKQVARYANAANSFAGWYFLALYLPRRRSFRSLHVEDARTGHSIIRRAVALERHGLAELLEALYAVCAENNAIARVDETLDALERLYPEMREPSSEYWRFMDATSETWKTLGTIGRRARALFREFAK